MKVLMLINDSTYTYNLRAALLHRLVQEGHEVVVACEFLKHVDALREMGCRLEEIQVGRHGTNPLADLALMKQYHALLKRERPDLVLTYNIKPNVYGGMACRMLKIPTMPNITGLGTPVEHEGLMQKLTTRLYKAGVAGAACVFFQNEDNRSFFRAHNMLREGARTRVLPGSGVDLQRHCAMEYPADGTIHFLFVARVMQEKGIDLYLQAAERIHRQFPDTLFHVCGMCDDEKYVPVLKAAEEAGYLKYHGEQSDMLPFFEMAHCLVHPSYYPEGMSNVLLEAAAHARPAIATDRAGCRETVDDGKTGYVIPIRDAEALIRALKTFLSLPWAEKRAMGLAGREKMEREFDRRLVVEAYMEEIEKL